MSEEHPCPSCGEGAYNLRGKSFAKHFHYCNKIQRKSPSGSKVNFNDCTQKIPTSSLEEDDIENSTFYRNMLQAQDSLPLLRQNVADGNNNEPYVFNDNDEERWEL